MPHVRKKKSDKQTCVAEAEQSSVRVEAHVTVKCSTAATTVERQHSLLCVEQQSW